MALVSVSEAARLIGQSRTPLYKAIKSGAISTLRDDFGKTVLDTSELFRVFPAAPANDDRNNGNKPQNRPESKPEQGQNSTESAVLAALLDSERAKSALLAQSVEALQADKNDLRRERDRLLGLVESQSEQVRLLTDQREKAQAVAVAAPLARSWWWPWG